MSERLTVSEQRALAHMGFDWMAENFAGQPIDGAWRHAPEYRAAVAEVETAEDRRARELADMTERHTRERATLEGTPK
jgi:hypothetical protein